MTGADRSVTEKMDVKEKNQVLETVDVKEPVASREPGPQAVGTMEAVRGALYPTSLLHNADLRELVHGHRLTYEKFLLGSVVFVLSSPPHIS